MMMMMMAVIMILMIIDDDNNNDAANSAGRQSRNVERKSRTRYVGRNGMLLLQTMGFEFLHWH